MAINQNLYSEDIKKIEEIEFSVFRNKDIKKYSVVSNDPYGIDLPESYDGYEPKKGGLVDLRLGTCDMYLPCNTCGCNSYECPGHFGHTDLAMPVFHFGFLNHLKNRLQCICLKCSKLLVEKYDKNKFKNKKLEVRFKEIKNLTKNINYCFHCGIPVPKIKVEIKDVGTIKIIIERETNTNTGQEKEEIQQNIKKTIKESLSPQNCYDILRNISDEECEILGFNPKIFRPEDLIITTFIIPPVIIRPTAKVDFMSSATMEDALTLKISDIIIRNRTIRQQLEKETLNNELSSYNLDNYHLLQYHIATYYDNESVKLPRSEFKTGNRITKSISDRIKGKSGRVRSNLMGKRVDFSARSVITSDPYIDIDQVGIPKKIAMELTIPEEVTPYNIKYLTELVKNGRDIYPGANFVVRINYRDGHAENQKIDLKYRKKAIRLNYGDIVERHSIDGDYVLFNRQPTLHKPSMMGHKIQVIDNDDLNTFRMNVSVCKPYNADFDGDEMNIHLAQSFQARNELKRIANVQYQIVSVKDSSPIIGCQQDTLAGGYLLTSPHIKIKGWEVANILCNTTSESKFEIEMDKEYTGHEIFSHIIPDGINVSKDIEIINGKLIKGYLKKKSLSFEKNSIIHFIWDKFGPNKTRKFIDDSQRLVLNFLLLHGQTVGIKDTLIDNDISEKIKQIINNKILESKYDITQFENEIEQLSIETIETSLSSNVNIIQSIIGELLSTYFKQDNFFKLAAISGAKGKESNIAQVSGVIGQLNVENARIKKRIEGRSLIYFHKDDDTPEARGFINNSFLTGLRGYEFFYNAMGGREGLIDTAIKTAQTGYIQRQLIKGLEDLSIKYDGTNRNAKGVIIQLVYGENGINQSSQTDVKIDLINMNNLTVKNKLCFSDDEIKILENNKMSKKDIIHFNEQYYNKLLLYRDNLRIIQQQATINFQIIEDIYVLPVNLFRITQDYSNLNNELKSNKQNYDLLPKYIEDSIELFLNDYDNRLIISLKKDDKYMMKDDRSLKYLLEIALYEFLSPKKCIFNYKLNKNQFDKMMKEIKLSFIKSLIEPGEMVGIIAAQSVGEPTSQMTLNTKHFAGVASKGSNVNMGVNRIQELLHYSKSIKTPRMNIYFNEPYNKDRNALNKIISYFKHLTIRHLLYSAHIYYDLFNNDELSKLLSNDNVSGPFFINNQKADINSLPFVFRIKIDIEKMIDKEITLLDIKTKFIAHWYKNYTNFKNLKKNEKEVIQNISRCAILSNNITDKEQIIHIRFNMSTFNYNIITEFLRMVFDDITLKGIENILNIDPVQEHSITYNKNTGDIINEKEYVVYTSGINFEKLRTIKGIDFTRTKCNDIQTTLRLYGIEAARQILLHELTLVYNSDGSGINHNHLSVLIDQMCHTGEITSIDRHGLSKLDCDPIARASFEKTMDHFINAAVFNEKDKIKSLSSAIAIGRVIPGGTGSFELLLDTKKLENSEYTEDESGGRITFTPLEEEPLFQDLLKYSINKTDFFIPKMKF
jgi:DNA-directed RNA polymerase II subunit RPB1